MSSISKSAVVYLLSNTSKINSNNVNLQKNLCPAFEFQQQNYLQSKLWQKSNRFETVLVTSIRLNNKSSAQNKNIEK